LAIGIITMDMAGGRTQYSVVCVGSSQSKKEGDERKEEKMDLIIKMLDPKNDDAIFK
jgi:hypothetical protein